MYITISGLQGSGKSYLCHKLNKYLNVKCVDYDDLYIKNKMNSNKANEQINYLIETSNKPFILTGVKTYDKNANINYLIKVSDLKLQFRRYLLREVDKIVENKDVIKKIIRNDPVEKIENHFTDLIQLQHCWWDFKQYHQENQQLIKQMKHLKHIKIMTQEQIFNDIKKRLTSQ